LAKRAFKDDDSIHALVSDNRLDNYSGFFPGEQVGHGPQVPKARMCAQ
jgi:hypothetical protein